MRLGASTRGAPSGWTSRRRARRRALGSLALVVLLLGAAVGHWLYHYRPRPRAAVPRDDLPARLADHPEFETALWVPYPHQTLRALARRTGVAPETMRTLAAAHGLEIPDLAGSRGLPPATSLAACISDDGRVAVAVQLYPLAAGFARLAGAVADNPWLRGGQVVEGDRRFEISWSGRTWRLASPVGLDWEALETHRAQGRDERPSLALVRDPALGRAALRTVAGSGGASGTGLELATAVDAPAPVAIRPREVGSTRPPFAAVLVAWSAVPRRALLLAPPTAPGPAELPRTASLAEPGAKRWRLPLEGLLEATGHAPLRAQLPAWSAVATDDGGLAGSRALATILDRRAAELERVRFGVWLELGPGSAELERLARQLEGSPLIALGDRRRATAWAGLARAVSTRYDLASLVVEGEARTARPRFSLRLEPAPPAGSVPYD